MKIQWTIFAAVTALGLAVSPAGAVPPSTMAGLSPCAFAAAEIQTIFGVTIQQTDHSDMAFPGGRDVGCMYTIQGSSFVFGVRQNWDNSRSSSSPRIANKAGKRLTAIAGDADGAVFEADTVDTPGAGGELVYVRGKVQTRVIVHGGRLTAAEVLQRIIQLRRVP